MKTVQTKSGVKVFENGTHVKTFSKKYLPIQDSIDFTTTTIRITPREKVDLDKILKEYDRDLKFKSLYSEYIEDLKKNEKYVFELIKDADFTGTRIINGINSRYEIVFSNGRVLKCSEQLHRVSLNKVESKNLNY